MDSIEGTVVYMRSEPRPNSTPCICCEGEHIFSYSLDAAEDTDLEWVGKNIDTAQPTGRLDYAHFIWRMARATPEGSRVRITFEVLDD